MPIYLTYYDVVDSISIYGYHRGIELDGTTVGIAYVGTMCNVRYSLGLTQDGGDLLEKVITVATHEMGHNFNMEHDTGGLQGRQGV